MASALIPICLRTSVCVARERCADPQPWPQPQGTTLPRPYPRLTSGSDAHARNVTTSLAI